MSCCTHSRSQTTTRFSAWLIAGRYAANGPASTSSAIRSRACVSSASEYRTCSVCTCDRSATPASAASATEGSLKDTFNTPPLSWSIRIPA